MHTRPVPSCPETDVVVVGEALIDIIDTAAGAVEFPGGSGLNVAFGLGRLDVSTTFLTALGKDARSERIQEHLGTAGVRLLPGAERLPRTSTATAVLDSNGSADYEFDFHWDLPHVSPTFLPKVLHTGSLAAFIEPGATQVRALLELFSGRCLITYDPNIRPTLLPHHAEALRTFEDTTALATVVKLSSEDALWLYPRWSLAAVGRRLLDVGAEAAIITDGGSGSFLCSKSAEVHVPARVVAVKDTVGAGDSYMSALVAGLIEEGDGDFDAAKLTRLGTAASLAAAITVGRHGANPPTRAELTESLELAHASRKDSNV
ncbi:PfkB family carbohydrate kinase [Paenarthrobacter aurescens]|uniref:PfkB family carbohydrate kinase n=1 Tax=Paenarthrobacter aurescens TaxID=43663 RepID=UPI0021BF7006|nr:PfkB family carbohydrate kinase [Paenarthrobacter aurescens]MCT9870708.1 PfkB family carbohydrate kinase [Paenarthrobacter aurescens]